MAGKDAPTETTGINECVPSAFMLAKMNVFDRYEELVSIILSCYRTKAIDGYHMKYYRIISP